MTLSNNDQRFDLSNDEEKEIDVPANGALDIIASQELQSIARVHS